MSILKIFENDISIVVEDNGFKVNYTHFLEKRKNYSLSWEDISKIYVFQLEPFVLYFSFFDSNDKGYLVSEDMKGWDKLVEYMKKKISNFNWDKFEEAKFTMRDKILCWSVELI
jgi:hypothetical protein